MRNKFSLIILTLLCLAGCNKDEPINNNDLYNDQLFSLSVAKKHLDSLLTINDIQLQVNWDQAALATDSTFSFVEVPYTAKEVKYNLYRLNNEDVNNDLSRAKYSRSTLLIYLSNEGELKTNIITYIPDTSYINDNDRILDQNRFASLDRKFSGYIEYKDILGTPTRLLMIKQGEVKRSFSLSPGNGTLQPNKKMSNGAANGTKITADMQQMTTSNCTPVCMPVFAEVCAGPACPGPMPEDCQCSVQQVG
ncbi:MAG: hypothetical protein M5Z89_19010, partial [Olivibacter sp.]|nr:hypothetical protein [Olivibacter sp. UJ_SKK_5.1]